MICPNLLSQCERECGEFERLSWRYGPSLDLMKQKSNQSICMMGLPADPSQRAIPQESTGTAANSSNAASNCVLEEPVLLTPASWYSSYQSPYQSPYPAVPPFSSIADSAHSFSPQPAPWMHAFETSPATASQSRCGAVGSRPPTGIRRRRRAKPTSRTCWR